MHNYPSRSISYEGKLEGPLTGQVTFSKYKDRTAGTILLDDGTKYIIDQMAPGIFTISLSNESAFIQKDSQPDFIEVSGQTQLNESVTSVCDMGTCQGSSTIDMMVVYTPQAESSWGGEANTVANITQAVTNMNASMSNSGINNVTFRLVHTAKIGYTESGNFSTDLTRLSGSSDGYMDNVHALRDQYGADLVSLVIGSPNGTCGMGYLNTNPSAYSSASAFNVSLYSCVVGNFTLAHENGHNMGLRHDWYVDASTSPCSHHHGYVNEVALAQGTSSPASARWRTIMAYNDRCAVAGFNCNRVNIWSNPNLIYNGDAAGKAIGAAEPSDEAYAFHRMACLVAAFRPETGGGGGGGSTSTCSAPSGLNIINLTTSSGTATWNAVSGASSYDVDYKTSSSGFWINIAAGTTSTSWNLAAMSPSTSYDLRVRANCASGSSSYTQSQFTTQGLTSCNAPSGLSTSSITTSSATASWSPVTGANSYSVDYKTSSSGTWINIASGTTSTSWNLAGLSSLTSYDWRVRANCASGSSGYTQSQFLTLGLTSCNAPSGLNTTSITTTSATAIWSPVSGANSYNVDYKASSSGMWINIASGTTATSWNLAGMSPLTSYEWRVRANCASGSSGYTQSQFLTQGLTSCNAPSGLNTTSITTTSATAIWSPVSGANSYNVDYKASSSGMWINIASGTTATSWNLAGMSPLTSYDWRVSANCGSGSSSYTQSQFLTQGFTSCNAPSGLNTLSITTSSATASWNVVSGATSYDVDYKASSSGNWINIASGTTATSWNLAAMSPSTYYDWRVRANCASGSSSYTQSQFSTQGLTSCAAPSGLSTLSITTSTATASWNAVSGANSYDVDYKASSSGAWINIAAGTTSTSWNLAGIAPSTSYDWRVRANCFSGNSSYSLTQFSTQGFTSCSAPSGLTTLSITTSSAVASWNAVSGALSYDVDYKTSSSGNWINIASGTTTTTWSLLGMPAATSFDWRVRANCVSGNSIYSQTQFSTQGLTSCNAPSGLSTLSITTSSATASWNAVSGANSYDVDYKASSSGNWINIASGTTATSWSLLGMPASTSFDWRVRANCVSGSSAYSQTQFTTQGFTSCNAPSGLSTLSITTNSAVASWNTVSGAISYDVDYKASSSGNWINIASGTTSTSWSLLGMPAATSFDWRVRANCSSGSSGYAQTSFSTLSQLALCSAPTGLSTSAITASAATANWAPVNGATSYNVDYKPASSADWITIANGTTSLQWTLSGMEATTTYDWRVRANCTPGNSSYTQMQFTTLGTGSCGAPGGLTTSNITSGTATMNWNAVSGAFAYTVQYKAASSGTWLTAASATYSTSYNLYGLSAGTTYDWRVYANCSLTEAGNFSTTQFTTSGSTPQSTVSGCPGPNDVSTNGAISGAAAISLNTDVKGTIDVRNDIDHYQFTISSYGTINVWLTTLPANYDLAVLNGSGTQIAIAETNGTQSESVSLSLSPGIYYAKVYPRGNAYSASSCYTLRVQTGTASDVIVKKDLDLNLFPNPAESQLNVWIGGFTRKAEIRVYDMTGKLVMQQLTGNTLTQLNIAKLTAGIYMVKVNDGIETKAAKFVKK